MIPILSIRTLALVTAICASVVCSAAQEPDDPLPTLDELLGLETEQPANPDGSPTTENPNIEDPNAAALDKELDAVLTPQQAGEAFTQAVQLMDQVAGRISDNNDLSIATQRLQEDILAKLDQVIEAANENNSNNSSSSSSSSQSSSEQQDQPDQQQPQQGEGDQQNPSNQSGEESMPGGASAANPPDGVSWGALPSRIRDALSQGISDKYSELYRTLTEQYYKSLAEDEDQ